MSRHCTSDAWEPGDYIAGHIDAVDSEGRGRVGNERSDLYVRGDVSEGRHVFAEIVDVTDDEVIAERSSRPSSEETVWAQQSQNTDSTMAWYPEYPFDFAPAIYHCNLFTEVEPSSATLVNIGAVPKDEPPAVWRSVFGIFEGVLGIGLLLALAAIVFFVLSQTVLGAWGAAIGEAPILLLPFLMFVGLTYAGYHIYETLIYISGAILGGAGGIFVGFWLVDMFQLSGNVQLGVVGVTMSLGAGLVGGLFLLLHFLAIFLGAFTSVAFPTIYLLSGGVVLSPDANLLSPWLLFVLFVGLVFGGVAGVLALFVYELAIILITSFVGAFSIVYIPTIARSAAAGTSLSFPNLEFVVVIVSGIVIQFLTSGSEGSSA